VFILFFTEFFHSLVHHKSISSVILSISLSIDSPLV